MSDEQTGQPAPASPQPDDVKPGCGCDHCLKAKPIEDGYPIPHNRRRMVVCEFCGNKRCPHATYHGYVCTGSNVAGQTPILADNMRPPEDPQPDAWLPNAEGLLPDRDGMYRRFGDWWIIRLAGDGWFWHCCMPEANNEQFEDAICCGKSKGIPQDGWVFVCPLDGHWHPATAPMQVDLPLEVHGRRVWLHSEGNGSAWYITDSANPYEPNFFCKDGVWRTFFNDAEGRFLSRDAALDCIREFQGNPFETENASLKRQVEFAERYRPQFVEMAGMQKADSHWGDISTVLGAKMRGLNGIVREHREELALVKKLDALQQEKIAGLESAVAALRERVAEADYYRERYGCIGCGEHHPREVDCPPHEVRTTGLNGVKQTMAGLTKQITALCERCEAAERQLKFAEHPADSDELVSEEWLRAVGFCEPTINGYSFLIPCSDGDPVELWIDHDGWVSLIQSNKEDHVTITSREYKTRHDVRRLCQALGIELREGV